jgi:IS30 family transposase
MSKQELGITEPQLNFLRKFIEEVGNFGITKMWNSLKNKNPLKITKKQLTDYLKAQEFRQLTAQPTKQDKKFSRIESSCVGCVLQGDLIDMSKYSRINKNFNWIFTIIDVYSRYGWAIPMKTKEPKNSAEAFNKVLSQFTTKGIKIQNFTSDNGNEFKGEFSTLLEKQDIKHYTHEPLRKIERKLLLQWNSIWNEVSTAISQE